MTRAILGLDIGGANLKAAVFCAGEVTCQTQRFALWRDPAELANALARLIHALPTADEFAVTMTGELCDCFASKGEGIRHILDAVDRVAAGKPIYVWCVDGTFRTSETAREAPPLLVAAANWLALATWGGRLAPEGPALLLDVGSTTTDVIPLHTGIPVPLGRTDRERLSTLELVYTGVRRTPLCVLLPTDLAAEWFATTLDVYLVLGEIPDDPLDGDTADGRPATFAFAEARLARATCEDLESSTQQERFVLARHIRALQERLIGRAVRRVAARLASSPAAVMLAGSGEFLARSALAVGLPGQNPSVCSLGERLGPSTSTAACAHAVAVLLSEQS
jgi:probable H4MPT-linked C1 transfer pathway protein